MRRVFIILLVTFIPVSFICADPLYSDSISTIPKIKMVLSPMSTKSTTVGFSSTSIDDTTNGLTPITGTQILELKYDKVKNATVTVDKTIYAYWVVIGRSGVNVKLEWDVDSSMDIFTVTYSSENGYIASGVKGSGSAAINITAGALNSKEVYDEVYNLTFTLTAEAT